MAAASPHRRVAVLDDYNGLAPGYVDGLRSHFEELVIFRDTILPFPDATPLIQRLKPFDVICTMRERTPLPASVLNELPNLKIILTTGMQNRGIDMEVCKARGIHVAGTTGSRGVSKGVPKDFAGTVQQTWALILALATNIPRDQRLIETGAWVNAMPLNTHIAGLTLGIVGLGHLGMGTARIGKLAFGMKILAWSSNLTQEEADKKAKEAGLASGDIKVVGKEDIFAQSDILSVHYVLSERSRGIIQASDLERMKPTSFIINTSRGPLIDEPALLDALKRGAIRGAGLDVFDVEPLPLDSPWRTVQWGKDGTSEVVMTPHTGYSFQDSIMGMWEGTKENLTKIAEGNEVQWRIA